MTSTHSRHILVSKLTALTFLNVITVLQSAYDTLDYTTKGPDIEMAFQNVAYDSGVTIAVVMAKAVCIVHDT